MIKTSNTAKLVVALTLLLACSTDVVLAQEAPDVAARAWVLTDIRSGEVFAGENASARLPMASTTKIMVSFVALQEDNLEEEVTLSEESAAFATPLYSNVGLVAGDTLSARELLMATMISSGDDAAYALAEHLGDGSARRFVEEMNREAETFGLEDTHFETPVGLDARGQYSSARDLARMTHLAMGYPEFREMVGTTYASITTQDREIPLTTTNDLLSLPTRPPPASRRERRQGRAPASSPRPPRGTSLTSPSYSTPEKTASGPPSGRSSTASPPTTARTSS